VMNQKALNSRKQLFLFFMLGGILGLIFGGIHLSAYLQTQSGISLSDACLNAGLGLGCLIGAWLTSKGRILVAAVAGLYVLAALIYGLAVGRGVNYFALLFGAMLGFWIYTLWKDKLLS
jgi:hypothetical protein